MSFTMTYAGFMPAVAMWISCKNFLMTGGYYLRSGFIDLHKAMQGGQDMIVHLPNYKHQHMHLSELTATLDRICTAYIGTALAMAAFGMCLVIFILLYIIFILLTIKKLCYSDPLVYSSLPSITCS